jgi:hypothetical protein
MARSKYLLGAGIIIAAILVANMPVMAQDPAQSKSNFYDVQLSKDEIYSYKNLRFTGDYFSLESASGFLALGHTEAGVTIVILLGLGNVTIETTQEFQEKFKTTFSAHPLRTSFKTVYMRLNPKEYAETIGKQELAKSASEETLTKAKEVYDLKFLASYHAGPKALLPDYKTRRAEFETDAHGWVVYDEGYWLTLFRVSPYAKIYPTGTLNPKQK